MHSLAFDSAARYSGAALLDPEGKLLKYWTLDAGPWNRCNPQTNLRAMRAWVHEVCDFVDGFKVWHTVENLSHYMSNPAPALRMQGVLLDRLDWHGHSDPVIVLPSVWQNGLGWHKDPDSKMTSKKWAKWLCESLGYDVEPTPGSKGSEDARDAVLIAKWRQLREAGQVP